MSKPNKLTEFVRGISPSAVFCTLILLFVVGFAAFCASGWMASVVVVGVVFCVLVGVFLWWLFR